ncbi:MAG: flagellar assembly peptidoglycan hydrolase FlgJ [Spongiibacteraceae bacterium]
MMPSNAMNAGSTVSTTSSPIYTDLGSVQSLKGLAARDKNAALKEIAHQFEAVMVQMMMKSMRDANAVFGQDDPLNSHEAQMYQDMFDSQLSLSLTKGKGMGIADALMRQLQGRVGLANPNPAEAAAETAAAGAIPLQRSAIHASQWQNLTSALSGDSAAANGDDTYEQLLALISDPSLDNLPPVDVSRLATDRLDGSPEQFVDALMPVAEQVSTRLGVDSRVLLSQAALETGWGEKVIRRADGSSSFNFFNIKADANWKGGVVTVPTLEYRDGIAVRETANFRAYNSAEESFADYAQLIGNNPRYQDALARAGDPRAYVHALQRAGYATDPQYAQKVMSVFSSDSLQQAAAPISAAAPAIATIAVKESHE